MLFQFLKLDSIWPYEIFKKIKVTNFDEKPILKLPINIGYYNKDVFIENYKKR